jgi:hypothetical protein
MATTVSSGATNKAGLEDSRSCAEIIDELLEYVGGRDSAKVRKSAERALRAAVGRFNRTKAWKDRLLRVQITLVADQRTYALPTRWRNDWGRAWLIDDNHDRRIRVEFVPADEFSMYVDDETGGGGLPDVYTVFNRVDIPINEEETSGVEVGQLELWPKPSSATITNYPKMEFNYYADIPVCSDSSSDRLGVSTQLESAIVEDAKWRLVQAVGPREDVPMLRRIANEAIVECMGYDNERFTNISSFKEFF